MYTASFLQDPDFIRALYIVAFAFFIYGLHELNHPRTARRGNRIAAVGMAIAVAATLLIKSVGDYGLIALGVAVGTAVGVPAARSVKMTAMPQMVALFNGVGGGAAALVALAEFHDRAPDPGRLPFDTSMSILGQPGSGRIRCNSASAISAAAPPPTPLNSATICGIAVIFTLRAAGTPTAVPIAMPTAIRP